MKKQFFILQKQNHSFHVRKILKKFQIQKTIVNNVQLYNQSYDILQKQKICPFVPSVVPRRLQMYKKQS